MAGDVTNGYLERTTTADYLAGQKKYDVDITGGSITGVTIDLTAPLTIADGGTGQITANAALNALLPNQTGQSGKALKTNGTNASWSTDTDTGITQLTGDVTAGPGSGTQTATLATVNSNVGSFGSSTSIPSVTVNAKGLITAASGNAVIAPAGTLTGTTLASNVVSSSLTSVGTLANLTVTNPISGSVTTNANLTGVITSVGNATSIASQTGTGTKFVVDTSPTLVTPNIGTPSAGTLTSCTGLPISTGVSGLGTGVATFLATPTSANLAAAVTNETGTGALVFGTAPTLSDFVNSSCVSNSAQFDKTSDTTIAAVTGMSVALSANAVYSFDIYITGTAGAAGGVKFALDTPASPTSLSYTGKTYNGTLVVANTTTTTAAGIVGAVTGIYTDATIKGTIRVGASSGNLRLFMAQNASSGTTTSIFANSYMTVNRIS